ncbi:MAG: hypothetical protein ACD_45C00331G0002 [uncultured bacterium]|nr:MAG: hypothetical protein ACD_45C00331G0002 [uncultured bacterium]OGT55953.1 MAG: orotate phosphoribosyltransferase [Gammaproteobacteria bacterium RIFCSPHIGHO2_12_FULL_42_10]
MNDQQALITSLYQIGAIQFGHFKLKSGLDSKIYINLRKIISYPDILRQVSAIMWEKVSRCQFHVVCGVPYTALPIATTLSLEHNIPMIMRRKEKKNYGTKQSIEGEFKAGDRCLVIEDVITSGSSILETVHDLINAHLVIDDVIVLVDREQGGKETLTKQFHVHTVLTLSQILQTLLASTLLSADEREILKTLAG